MSLYSIVLLFFVAFSLQGKNLYWDFKELQQEGERYVFKSSKDSGLLRASQVLQHQGIDSGHALQCGPEIMHRISRHRLDMQNAEIAISFKPTADITAKSSLYTYQENTWGRAYFDVFISKNSEIGLLFRINTPEEKKEFELLTPPVRLDSQRYHDLRITLQSGGMGRIYLDGRLLAEENGAYCFSDFKAPPVDQHHPFAQIGSSYYYCGIHQPFTGLIAKLSIQEMPAVGKALETSLAPDAQPAAQSRSNANILAKPCVSPLLIDGKFAEPCYDDAEWSIPFMVLGSMSKDINGLWLEADSKFSRAAAKAAVFYDQEYIYAAIKAPFPVDLPPKAEMKNGENIWLDDCVEFFLHNDQQYYYQILVNAKGAWQAIKYSLDGSLRIDWEPQGVMVAGNLREAEFNIEIALPFKELGESSPQDGAVWKVNFAREGASCGGLSTWAAVGTSFLAPDRFGKLIFGNRKAYYKQQFQALQEQSKRLPEIPEQLQEILRETATLIAKEGDKPAAWLNLHNQLDMLRNRIVQASNKGKSLLLLEADMWANFPPQRKIPFALQEPTELKLEAPGGSRAIGSLLLCNLSERLSMGNLLFKADKGSEAIEPLLRFREVAFIELSGGTMIPDPIFELPMGSMLRVPPNSTVMLWLDLDCSDLKPGDYSGNIKLYPSYSGVEEKQLKLSLRVSPVD
ncbi:MAG: carbohydrate-binding family 9-like protein, partial [Lentisphaeria bacterium]|nr:carbohydrate-binding family 9-like protein [Lentisphaeria bacterium]